MADKITDVYGGRAQIKFLEFKHYYTVSVPGVVESLYQPSVTQIIGVLDKPGLIPWAVGQMADRIKELLGQGDNFDRDALHAIIDAAKNTWNNKRQEAADIGSLVHEVLERYLHGTISATEALPIPLNFTEDMAEKAFNSVKAGFKFIDAHDIQLVQTESPRWSAQHGYIGTGDLIASVDGKLSVLDWKTSKKIYPTVFLQTAAYQRAYEEEFRGEEIQQRVAVNVGKDGTLRHQVRDNSTIERDFNTFLALLEAWKWNQVNDKGKPAPRVIGNLYNLKGD